jgi:hypothetical protein
VQEAIPPLPKMDLPLQLTPYDDENAPNPKYAKAPFPASFKARQTAPTIPVRTKKINHSELELPFKKFEQTRDLGKFNFDSFAGGEQNDGRLRPSHIGLIDFFCPGFCFRGLWTLKGCYIHNNNPGSCPWNHEHPSLFWCWMLIREGLCSPEHIGWMLQCWDHNHNPQFQPRERFTNPVMNLDGEFVVRRVQSNTSNTSNKPNEAGDKKAEAATSTPNNESGANEANATSEKPAGRSSEKPTSAFTGTTRPTSLMNTPANGEPNLKKRHLFDPAPREGANGRLQQADIHSILSNMPDTEFEALVAEVAAKRIKVESNPPDDREGSSMNNSG